MIPRQLTHVLREALNGSSALYVGGPRQSGKTTLLRAAFPDLPYVNFEALDVRQAAAEDPRGFLAGISEGAILDEVQRLPELFNYLQETLDNSKAQYILSGSQNFLLLTSVTQSLAGRVSILQLYPFSYAERPDRSEASIAELVWRGAYPRVVAEGASPARFYESYLQTYLERDVRAIANVTNLGRFQNFIRVCAARTAQPLNYAELARATDIATNTAKDWYSILQASYLASDLQPYYRNFEKRLRKTPKHYLLDTGLACFLLGIESPAKLADHYLYGELVETWLVSERLKQYANAGRRAPLFYWRDSNGHEIDLLEDVGKELPDAWKLKSSATGNTRYFKPLTWWQGLTGALPEQCGVVYCGDRRLSFGSGEVIPFEMWLSD